MNIQKVFVHACILCIPKIKNIVYCGTRKKSTQVRERLRERVWKYIKYRAATAHETGWQWHWIINVAPLDAQQLIPNWIIYAMNLYKRSIDRLVVQSNDCYYWISFRFFSSHLHTLIFSPSLSLILQNIWETNLNETTESSYKVNDWFDRCSAMGASKRERERPKRATKHKSTAHVFYAFWTKLQ